MSEKEYAYALDEDGEYRFDNEEEAMDEAIANCNDEDFPPSICRGEKVAVKLSDFFDAYGFFETLRESAYGELFGEYVDYWLEDVTPEQIADLKAHLDAWAAKNGHQPTFFRVKNVEQIKVKISVTKAELGHE